MTKRNLAMCLIVVGVGVFVFGYFSPNIRQSNRPYAYISIMAVGAMLMVGGGLLWRDS